MGNISTRLVRSRRRVRIRAHPVEASKPLPWKDIPEFVPPITQGVVIKVYDGDTIWVASELTFIDEDGHPHTEIYKFNIRPRGFDTPEIRTRDEDEKQIAYKARDFLRSKIMNQMVYLKNLEPEAKWGRILADVYWSDRNLADVMVGARLAVPYNGGTKYVPQSWIKYNMGLDTPMIKRNSK